MANTIPCPNKQCGVSNHELGKQAAKDCSEKSKGKSGGSSASRMGLIPSVSSNTENQDLTAYIHSTEARKGLQKSLADAGLSKDSPEGTPFVMVPIFRPEGFRVLVGVSGHPDLDGEIEYNYPTRLSKSNVDADVYDCDSDGYVSGWESGHLGELRLERPIDLKDGRWADLSIPDRTKVVHDHLVESLKSINLDQIKTGVM